jgi:hypothetical protein
VDNKHNLVVAHTINRNDLNALGAIALEAKENLGVATFTVLVDKGYHNGRKLPNAKQQHHHHCSASYARNKQRKRHATGLLVAKFKYNAENDSYNAPRRNFKNYRKMA